MFENDNSKAIVDQAAEMCKREVMLYPDGQQSIPESGNLSAPTSGPSQQDANPAGAPGVGR